MAAITSAYPPQAGIEQSRFLRDLPSDFLAQLSPELELVSLTRGDLLLEAGEPIEYVYFPTTCLVSIVVTLENGSTIEASTVGNNGFVGVSAFLGRERAGATAQVQIAGDALRLSLKAFHRSLDETRWRDILGGYTAMTFATIAQSTACIAFHPVHERLARWLLIVQDGIVWDEFPLTHDFLSVMLGVHRPTVTIAMRLLESAGLIEHRRGRISILDREALIDAACECYGAGDGRRAD